jgi:integrase
VTALLERLRTEHLALYRLVAVYRSTGCRRNEAIGLQASDVDFRAHTLTIARQYYGGGDVGLPKGRRSRTIDLSTSLERILRDAIVESDALAAAAGVPASPRWIFRSSYLPDAPWNPGHVTRVVSETARAVCGRGWGPKALRHAVATALLARGVSPRYAQLTLGHRDIATTMVYVDARPARNRAAVDALDDL